MMVSVTAMNENKMYNKPTSTLSPECVIREKQAMARDRKVFITGFSVSAIVRFVGVAMTSVKQATWTNFSVFYTALIVSEDR